ncbi:MAG: glycosyl hydrolase family 18 protein, partial [Candidatus Marinimicrobia bacterium]|nr:glycosyl hydrolase family 18 protein [Candidatus Neomarinimicrobiota bacterium]
MIKVQHRKFLTAIFILSFASAVNAQMLDQMKEHPGIHHIESELYRNVKSAPDESIPFSEITDFQPRIVKTTTHEVFGYLPYWLYSSYSTLNYQLLTTIAYFSAEITSTGGITNMHDWPASALVNKAHTNGVRVVLVATLFDSGTLATLLGNATYRHDCVMNLLDAVEYGNGDGVNIDFESMPASQKTNLVAFMQELADSFRVHIPNAHISMATPAVDWNGAWDYNALANICDALFIMGYDYYWSGSTQSGPNSPLTGGSINVTNTVNTYLSKTGNNGAKIVLGIPYYGHDWPTLTDEAHSQTTANAKSVVFSNAVVNAQTYGRLWDATSQTPWYKYYTTNWRQCWYDDSLSIALKYNLAKSKNLQGVGMWALGHDGTRPELWGALADAFGGSLPPPQPTGLMVLNHGSSSIRIHVDPQPSAGRFVIYSSADGITFDSLTTSHTNDTLLT